jgi:hypothetical protein
MWHPEDVSVQRGAWDRIYGIPIHAWNENFFKLCVMDCGLFLRTDGATLDRDRFDYARVLLATKDLEVINVTDNILVDGVLINVKIIEEWEFNLGEDACLLEEETNSVQSNHEQEDVDRGEDVQDTVDLVVENLREHRVEDEVEGVTKLDENCVDTPPMIIDKPVEVSEVEIIPNTVEENAISSEVDGPSTNIPRVTTSCPAGEERLKNYGLWSIDWMQDRMSNEASTMLSHKKMFQKKCI